VHDDLSTFGFAFNLKHKDHAAKALMDLDKPIKKKFQKQVCTLKMDNGGKFINTKLQTYCQERGITSSTSVAYYLELNGRAERQNRTHVKGAWTMLRDSDLGKDIWGEVISAHIYIYAINVCPESSLATPHHMKRSLVMHLP